MPGVCGSLEGGGNDVIMLSQKQKIEKKINLNVK